MDHCSVELILLTPGLPLLLALALAVPGLRAVVVKLAPWAALPTLAVLGLGEAELRLPWLLLGSQFGSDTLSRGFLLVTAPLWLLAGIYAQSYLAQDPHKARFFAFFLLAMAGNLGALVAQDAVSFYLFFALMSFAAYGLVIHDGKAASLRAGRVYIVLVLVGETFLLSGLLLWVILVGGLELTRNLQPQDGQGHLALGLLFAGFAVKAGVLGLHQWLPLAHPAAPTPASAVLSGAMIKLGVLGWLRFLPPGLEWGPVLVALGLAAAFYGVLAGLLQTNPKALLAYSSISQMGLITLAVGLGLVAPELWPASVSAVLYFLVHHGWAKGALFLSTGLQTGSSWCAKALLVLPALSLAAAPLTSGSLAKARLEALALALPWGEPIGLLLSLSSVATTVLMARFLMLVWPQPTLPARLPVGQWVGWIGLVACSTFAAWVPNPPPLEAEKLVASAWPVLLGAGLVGLASRLPLAKVLRLPGLAYLSRVHTLWSLLEATGRRAIHRRAEAARVLEFFQIWLSSNWSSLVDLWRRRAPPYSWAAAGVLVLGLILVQIFLLLS